MVLVNDYAGYDDDVVVVVVNDNDNGVDVMVGPVNRIKIRPYVGGDNDVVGDKG